MTCNELQDCVKSGSARAGIVGTDVLSHLERCSACRQWIEIEELLTGSLKLLRSSVPVIPATFDQSVLNTYRAQFQHAPSDVIRWKTPARLMRNLVCRAAVAALLVAGAILLFGNRKAPAPGTTATVQSPPVVSSAEPQTRPQSEAPKPAVTRKKAASRVHHTAPAQETDVSSTEDAYVGLPPDFRNLMYCDQLSCSGAMEVIRMNLPASSLGMASPLRTSNVVAADVLVGADGFARAIRIVN